MSRVKGPQIYEAHAKVQQSSRKVRLNGAADRDREVRWADAEQVRKVAAVHIMSAGDDLALLGLPEDLSQVHDGNNARLDGRMQDSPWAYWGKLIHIPCRLRPYVD